MALYISVFIYLPKLHQKVKIMAMIDVDWILTKELRIYRRSNESPNYYIGMKYPDRKEIHNSAKTSNKEVAREAAFRKFHENKYKIEQGISTQIKLFTSVATNFLKDYEKNVLRNEKLEAEGSLDKSLNNEFTRRTLNERKSLINKFIIPYFKGRKIHDIADLDIEEYKKWRKFYWVDGEGSKQDFIEYKDKRGKTVKRTKTSREKKLPSPYTTNRDLTAIKSIFTFAAEELRCIHKNDIPTIKRVKMGRGYEEEHRTKTFSEKEMNLLLATLDKKIKSQRNPKHCRSHKRLMYYIHIMANSGMRSSDTNGLKFSDCYIFEKNGKFFQIISVDSKGNKREIVCNGTTKWIKELSEFHQENSREFGWTFNKDTQLFCNDHGKPIKSLRISLKRLFKDCGLEGCNTKSFRPFYISQAINKSGISAEQLSKNTGHSPDVLRKHYDRNKATDNPSLYGFSCTKKPVKNLEDFFE